MKAAIRLLSRRQYSVHELRSKLQAKDFAVNDIDAVIEDLIKRHYLNDAELCRLVCGNYLAAAKHSLQYVKSKLKARGFEQQVIEQALDCHTPLDEERAALQALSRRYSKRIDIDRVKAFRYLASKGFSSSASRQAVAAFQQLNDTVAEENAIFDD